ncbi:MAG: HetZ-related protein [Coleofasciculaceae cyanobacterium RL_1_1]|nr:HetZ-related protein [Coleofasciculaceae cyanobacterium RL_1_1]
MNAKLDTVFARTETHTTSSAAFNPAQPYNSISVGSATAQAGELQNRNTSFDRAILDELQAALNTQASSSIYVAERIAREVERICTKSDRIQTSGKVEMWQLALARHRIQKIHAYFDLGSRRGRVELHSNLSMMVYRHIAPSHANLGFQGRYNHIEDFLQGFYIEVLRAFRREHDVTPDYTPKTRIELAEYMAFSEQYAKRRISLPGRKGQQLVILRAQGYAKGQPPEMSLDVEMAIDSAKSEADESHNRSAAARQVREHMVSESVDMSESVIRDRVVEELIDYLRGQDQEDCIDYLTLKLQDLPAHEIDEILNLTSRQRDYLQQRFKYHVEKFSRTGNWELVHQWLGADLDQSLGMSPVQWEGFYASLDEKQRQLVVLKQEKLSDDQIAAELGCTVKQVQKRWTKLLDRAWEARNA